MTDFTPHVTVATVVVKDQQFLLVEERVSGSLVYNQPAGHLESDETLQQAAVRETLEETGWEVKLKGVLGLSLYKAPANGVTYLRTCFIADACRHTPAPLDEGIERAVWLDYEEILVRADRMRSPMVIASVQRYLAGDYYPLNLIY